MNYSVSTQFKIADLVEVGEVRRFVTRLTRDLGFDETRQGQAAIIATEMGNNLAKHAKDGSLLVRLLSFEGLNGIEILSVDGGPGISNIGESLRDGYSTAGSPGTGMGAIQRLSTCFEIYSDRNSGTVVLSQLWAGDYLSASKKNLRNLEVGVVCLPNKGETQCGDNWSVHAKNGRNLILVADGLGHGVLAAEASEEAVKIVAENAERPPLELLELSNDALKKTRGAAVAIAELDSDHQKVAFIGAGNIVAAIIDARDHAIRRMVSGNGTVGLRISRPNVFQYDWHEDSVLILHSDGLTSHWKISGYPGLLGKHPSIIAAILFRDFKRGTDDVTILCARERQRG